MKLPDVKIEIKKQVTANLEQGSWKPSTAKKAITIFSSFETKDNETRWKNVLLKALSYLHQRKR